jgi:hypothetical protein
LTWSINSCTFPAVPVKEHVSEVVADAEAPNTPAPRRIVLGRVRDSAVMALVRSRGFLKITDPDQAFERVQNTEIMSRVVHTCKGRASLAKSICFNVFPYRKNKANRWDLYNKVAHGYRFFWSSRNACRALIDRKVLITDLRRHFAYVTNRAPGHSSFRIRVTATVTARS